uniref:Uncharacterized protein n=1 Tax=Arundo donax TaxID=35708 RepID=A0A0A8Y5J5_ARUDO
MVIYTFNVKRK